MKLQRYTKGQTNISQLEQGRAALDTPGEAAAREAAPYEAASNILGTAGEAVADFTKVREAQEFEGAKITAATGEANRGAAMKLLEDDPLLVDKMKADPDYYANSVKQINTDYMGSLNDIKDPRTKTRFQEAQKVAMIGYAGEAESTLINIQHDVKRSQAIETIRGLELTEQWGAAQDMVDASKAFFTDTETANQNARIYDGKVKTQVQSIADEADDIYTNGGEEAVREMLKAVVTDDDLSEDVQSKAEAAIKNSLASNMAADKLVREEYETSQRLEKDRRVADYIATIDSDTKTEDIHAIADAEELTRSERTSMINKRDKAITDGIKQLSFGIQFESGIPMKDSEANRISLDNHIRKMVTPDMTPEEIKTITMDAVNKAGFPTQQMRNSLKAGPRGAEDMLNQLDLFNELTDGEKKLELGLDDEEYSDYLYVKAMTEYVDTPEARKNVVEQWIQARKNKTDATMAAWTEKVYDGDTGEELLESQFESYYSEGQFEEGWRDPKDSYRNSLVKRELHSKFMLIGRKQIGLSATPDMAGYNANEYMQQMGRMTNINGKKENQLNLPPGTEDIDMRHMKESAVGQKGGLTGLYSGYTKVDGESKKVQYYQTVRGVIPLDEFDGDNVDLYVPLDKKASRDEKGNLVFEVYYNGNPMSSVTDAGQSIERVSFSQDDFVSKEAKAEAKRDITKETDKLRLEIKQLENMKDAASSQSTSRVLNIYNSTDIDDEIQQKKNSLDELRQQYFDQRKNK